MLDDMETRVLKRIATGTNYPEDLREIFGSGYAYVCRKLIKKSLIYRENKAYLLTEKGEKELN